MREHMGLFRGKRIDTGDWVEGFYCEVANSQSGLQEHFILTIKSDGRADASHKVDPNTVGECTGLRDKNGKLIFEGDMLRYYVDSSEGKRAGIAIVNFGRFKDADALSDFDHLGWYLTIPMLEEEATTIFALEEDGIVFDVIGNVYDDAEVNVLCGATNLPCIECSAGPCSNRKRSDNPELLKGGEGA